MKAKLFGDGGGELFREVSVPVPEGKEWPRLLLVEDSKKEGAVRFYLRFAPGQYQLTKAVEIKT